MFRKILLLSSTFLLAGAAQAADIIEPTAFDWTGPYIGLQGGYAWGKNDLSANSVQNEVEPAALSAAVIDGEDGSFDLEGFVGGAHAGINWQMEGLVLGLEGDIEYADLDGDTDVIGEFIDRDEVEVDWLGSLRLRTGFAADRALFYATGGLAVGSAKLTSEDGSGGEFADEKDTKWGWTLGGGIEYAFTDDLSGRVEYRYTDLGTINVRDADENVDDKADIAFHAVRVGLSWHFGGI